MNQLIPYQNFSIIRSFFLFFSFGFFVDVSVRMSVRYHGKSRLKPLKMKALAKKTIEVAYFASGDASYNLLPDLACFIDPELSSPNACISLHFHSPTHRSRNVFR